MLEAIDPAGVAAFIAALSTVIAIANSRPQQWGTRRIAFGVAICAGVFTAVLLTNLQVLYAALFWGGYQIYIGWRFIARRSGVSAERREYIGATAKVLSYIALLDGTISPAKSAIVRDTYTRAGFSADELTEVDVTMRDCQEWFVHGGSDPERIREPLREACSRVAQHSDNQTRVIVLKTALRLAASDGFVSLSEEKAIRAATEWLGLGASDIDAAWNEIAGTPGGPKVAVSSTSA